MNLLVNFPWRRQSFLLNGDDEALTRLRFSLKDISRRKKNCSVSAGYPADYLEPVYTCPDCKDTGYIEGGNGLRKKCHCFHQQELDILYEQSHIRDMIASENFFQPVLRILSGRRSGAFPKMRRCLSQFCTKLQTRLPQFILLWYSRYWQKAFLSGCIASELLQSGHSVIYFSASGLFDTSCAL